LPALFYKITVAEPDSTDSIHVFQGVFLNRTTVRGLTEIDEADIGGSLILLGANLGTVNMQAASIKNSFLVGYNLRSEGLASVGTRWADDAVLDLSNATIGSVKTPLSFRYWPKSIVFNNFDVGALSFNVSSEPYESLNNEIEWLEKWLDLQKDFSVERYHRVRATLQKGGNESAAAALGYVSRDRELGEAFYRGDPLSVMYLAFSKLIIGYGYRMWIPVMLACGFIYAGSEIFRRSTEAQQNKMPYGIAYSFDMLLPLIKLREAHYKIELISPAVRYYFYLHKTAGWVIGFFILAGLSGFTK
jgi:hypothetical protein